MNLRDFLKYFDKQMIVEIIYRYTHEKVCCGEIQELPENISKLYQVHHECVDRDETTNTPLRIIVTTF